MMKKILVTLILVLAGILALSSFVSAEADKITVVVDGDVLSFDQDPVIIDGRTLVPLRGIFEKLGAEVSWDDGTKTVTAVREDVTISLTVGQNVIFKNGNQIALDVPATIINSRTMVPARAVSECLEAKVDWNDLTRTVIISSDESLNDAFLMLENCDDMCLTTEVVTEAEGIPILMEIKIGIDIKNKLSLVGITASVSDYGIISEYTTVSGMDKTYVDDNGEITVEEGAGQDEIVPVIDLKSAWQFAGEDEEYRMYLNAVSAESNNPIVLYVSKTTNEPEKLLIKNFPAGDDFVFDAEFSIALNTGEVKAVFDLYNN